MDLFELLETANLPKNKTILDNFIRAYKIINDPKYTTILCSISGGSDSDVMMDIIYKVDVNKKVTYVWFDTGLEYEATKRHIQYLEKKYNVKIMRERAIKPIPISCKEYGQPFISKNVSKNIQNLQSKNFSFEDKPYDILIRQYCNVVDPSTPNAYYIEGKYYKGCIRSLKWWCNMFPNDGGSTSKFNINYNKYLKEFIISNPPNFKISSECCEWAKKKVSQHLIKKYKCDLMIIGVRKAEGGVRSTIYKNCFSSQDDGCDFYRPLFWYLRSDKNEYERAYNILHSDCYNIYGFERTGCCCCPYGWAGNKLSYELQKTRQYEPKLYKAVNTVFKDSYEYTMQYLQFRKEMKDKEKGRKRLF